MSFLKSKAKKSNLSLELVQKEQVANLRSDPYFDGDELEFTHTRGPVFERLSTTRRRLIAAEQASLQRDPALGHQRRGVAAGHSPAHVDDERVGGLPDDERADDAPFHRSPVQHETE